MFKLNLTTSLLFIILLLSACTTTYPLADNKLSYRKDIDIEIIKILTTPTQSTWGGSYAPKSNKLTLLRLTIQLKNNLNTEQEINLKDIYLVDAEYQVKYSVEKIFQATTVVIPARTNLKLDANEQVKRVLMFTYPKKRRPDMLEVNGSSYVIKYTNKIQNEDTAK